MTDERYETLSSREIYRLGFYTGALQAISGAVNQVYEDRHAAEITGNHETAAVYTRILDRLKEHHHNQDILFAEEILDD